MNSPSSSPIGVLLINLGTPKSPQEKDVKPYLEEFLMDPRVIDLPFVLRWLLVHLIILRTRPSKSAKAYQKVWTPQGSPLLSHTRELCEQLKKVLGPGSPFRFELAMRYQSPSVQTGLESLLAQGAREIWIFPLYPQYAESTTRSSIEKALTELQLLKLKSFDSSASEDSVPLKVIPPFYEEPFFIRSQAQLIKETLQNLSETNGPRHFLFTFHGLPIRHIQRTDSSKNHCLKSEDCCVRISQANQLCYRAQCFATARALAKELGLNSQQYTVSFQSRLNKNWIRPFTDDMLLKLAQSQVKDVVVVCPSFVADCLETIEEMGHTNRELFLKNGGHSYTLVPCVNSHPSWVEELKNHFNALKSGDRPFFNPPV